MGSYDKANVSLEVWKRLGGQVDRLKPTDQEMVKDIENNKVKNDNKDSPQNNVSKIPRPISNNLNENNVEGKFDLRF